MPTNYAANQLPEPIRLAARLFRLPALLAYTQNDKNPRSILLPGIFLMSNRRFRAFLQNSDLQARLRDFRRFFAGRRLTLLIGGRLVNAGRVLRF